MKLIFFFIIAFNLLSNNLEDKIKGKWISPSKKEIIEIYEKDGKYKAKIIWLKYPKYKKGTKIDGEDFSDKEKLDTKNPDKSKRDRKIIGLHLSEDLTYDFKKELWKGNIYNPSNGKKYYAEIKIKNDKLELRSYISIFYKTHIWSKKEL